MITLFCLGHSFHYEMEHIVRMFFPGQQIKILTQLPQNPPELDRWIVTEIKGDTPIPRVELHLPDSSGSIGVIGQELPTVLTGSEQERYMGVLLYKSLQRATGVTPPWGILTGVRPVRLCRQWEQQGMDQAAVKKRFTENFLVHPQKADLAIQTANAQREILSRSVPDSYSLYISIPFCPTRCLYCSFVSHAIDKAATLIPEYLRLLREELRETATVARKLGLKLHTIYIGGGTPTSLTAPQMAQVLEAVSQFFDLTGLLEYTVEAGRADTITGDKLELMQKFGVDRISINPQTMDDTILQAIGRAHTAGQVKKSYRLARTMGFSAINMDLIAGLPGETPDSFAKTLDEILELSPENITLHTLTVKRSSNLREREDAFSGSLPGLDALLGVAQARFDRAGYRPYYLYRQKGTVQNLENTGFSLPGHQGIYNIYSMEETHTILAVGAGAVTKLCLDNGKHIKRVCNFKYPYEYIGRFAEILERKASVEEFYEKYTGKKIHSG